MHLGLYIFEVGLRKMRDIIIIIDLFLVHLESFQANAMTDHQNKRSDYNLIMGHKYKKLEYLSPWDCKSKPGYL